MKALIDKGHGEIALEERPMPVIQEQTDAIVRVTRSSICSSDLHIIHGTVPRARENIVLGHEFTGESVEAGAGAKRFKMGDRVSVNVETFCGECYFCKRGYVNNCVHGGWELGCRIDGGQAARPKGVVVLAALYAEGQELPLHRMYGKNLTFRTGGVDANACGEIMELVRCGRLDTGCLITHRAPLNDVMEGYRVFGGKMDGCMKWVITPFER